MTHPLLEDARALDPWLVETRRHLHMHPELSHEEAATAAFCARALEAAGWRVRRGAWEHGVIADLEVEGARRRVALRADMDALPIEEQSAAPYRSQNPGVAHMCGHDAHMTIALGAARLLAARRGALRSAVRIILQPAEELPPGGALGMIEAGALDGVDAVYGLHNMPLLARGQVATRAGVLCAAADTFLIRVRGSGGHAARPHEARDPIPAACALVGQLQTLISRRCSPLEQAVLSVTRVTGGRSHNVIPDVCELEGTVRTFEPAVRDRIEAAMQRMVEGVCAAHGLEVDLRYTRGYDSVVNHDEGVARVAEAARAVLGAASFDDACALQSWGEDFSYYVQQRPGAFFLLGSGDPTRGVCEPLHSPRFDIDEACLSDGAALMAALAITG